MVIMVEISSLSPPLGFTKKAVWMGDRRVVVSKGRLLRPSYSVSLPIVIFLKGG